MQSTFKLALQIGASIGSSFKSSIKGSKAQLGQLGSSIDLLKSKQTAIGKYEIAEVKVGKARAAYNAASKDLVRLRKELHSTKNPSKQLQRSFESAKLKTERLSDALGKQKEHLQKSRRELERTGVSTRHLAKDNVRLGASVDKLSSKYKKLSAAVQAKDANKARRADLRGQLFDAVAIGSTVAMPVNIAIGFEKSISRLGAITRSSDAELKELTKTARSLGETTQFSASEAASAMTFLGMSGFKTNQIIAATPGMLDLAQAAGSDLADTADIASNILSGFSLKAAEMGRVGDVLTSTFTSSNTTLQMLGDTLKYAAPVASAAGSSIEEVAAMAGLLGNVGIQGSMAGTALRAAFLRLSAPPAQAAKAISSLGIEVSDLDGNMRPIPELLKDIALATQDMGSVQKTEAIKHIFGAEAAAGITELIKQAGQGELDTFIDKLKKSQGSAAAIAKKMSATTAGSLKRLGSALESVAISFGNVLLPVVAKGAEVFASVASFVSRASEEFPFLTKVVVGAAAALVTIQTVAIAGAYAYTFLKGGVLSLVTAYHTVTAGIAFFRSGMITMNALSALSAVKMGVITAAQWALNIAMTANPIGLIIVGIAALAGAAYGLIKYWEPISDFFISLWDGIQDATGGAVGWLIDKIGMLVNPFKLIGATWDFVSGFFDDEEETVKPKKAGKVATAVLGAAVASQPAMALPEQTIDANAKIAAVSATTNQQSVSIAAPITINTTPNMDERAVAKEVQKALDERQARANVSKRASLYDHS